MKDATTKRTWKGSKRNDCARQSLRVTKILCFFFDPRGCDAVQFHLGSERRPSRLPHQRRFQSSIITSHAVSPGRGLSTKAFKCSLTPCVHDSHVITHCEVLRPGPRSGLPIPLLLWLTLLPSLPCGRHTSHSMMPSSSYPSLFAAATEGPL